MTAELTLRELWYGSSQSDSRTATRAPTATTPLPSNPSWVETLKPRGKAIHITKKFMWTQKVTDIKLYLSVYFVINNFIVPSSRNAVVYSV